MVKACISFFGKHNPISRSSFEFLNPLSPNSPERSSYFSGFPHPKYVVTFTYFGWVKPKKYELLWETFGLNGFRDSKEDLEIGLCLPKDEKDAFTTIFIHGLIN